VILGKRKRADNQPKAPPTKSNKPSEKIRSYRIILMTHSALEWLQTIKHSNLENDPSLPRLPVACQPRFHGKGTDNQVSED
jgi:hypothetical protein